MRVSLLTKKGLILSSLPLLSLIVIAILWRLSETPSGLIPVFLSLFSFIPASLVYLVYLFIRQEGLPKSDPAYAGCRKIVKGCLLALGASLLMIVLAMFLGMMLNHQDFLGWILIKLSQLGVLVFLALPLMLPIAELVVYVTAHSRQKR